MRKKHAEERNVSQTAVIYCLTKNKVFHIKRILVVVVKHENLERINKSHQEMHGRMEAAIRNAILPQKNSYI